LVEGLEEKGFRLVERREKEEGKKPEKLSRFFWERLKHPLTLASQKFTEQKVL
jgi:hypothetical protein